MWTYPRWSYIHSLEIKPDLTCPSRIEIGSGLKKIKEIKTRGDKVKNSVTIH